MTRRLSVLTRRAVLAGLAALPAACVADGEPPAPRVPRFRAVVVDTGPFAAKGVSHYAARVGERLRVTVAEAFAGRIAPGEAGAPTLVIEVSTMRMAAWVGGRSHGGFGLGDSGGDTDDAMAGFLVLRSSTGAVIDRRRHAVTSDAASSGDWRLPDNEDRRLDALCRIYALWAAREFPE